MKRLDLSHISKHCLECGKLLTLRIKRDIERKNYCNHSCRAKRYFKLGILPQPPRPTKATRQKVGRILSLRMKQGLIPRPPIPTPEQRRKGGLARRGAGNGRWIKDRTQLKHSRFDCSEREGNETWRKDVFRRDDFTCQKTGIKGGCLRSHHIESYASNPALRLFLSNGITLSEKAHRKFHKIYGRDNNTREQLFEYLESA